MNRGLTMDYFHRRYSAVPADPVTCFAYLDEGCRLLMGLTFPDPAANYRLLSPSDLRGLAPEEAAQARATRRSPFGNMLLIFYEKENRVCCKLVNGTGSRLLELAERFCTPQAEIF